MEPTPAVGQPPAVEAVPAVDAECVRPRWVDIPDSEGDAEAVAGDPADVDFGVSEADPLPIASPELQLQGHAAESVSAALMDGSLDKVLVQPQSRPRRRRAQRRHQMGDSGSAKGKPLEEASMQAVLDVEAYAALLVEAVAAVVSVET